MRVIRLCEGKGTLGKSHCVMAATSIVAGEEFSDAPECVCPTIRSLLITLNDSYGSNNDLREQHLSHLPWLIIGTRGTITHQVTRCHLLAHWAITTAASHALRSAELEDEAKSLETIKSWVTRDNAANAARAANAVRALLLRRTAGRH